MERTEEIDYDCEYIRNQNALSRANKICFAKNIDMRKL